PWVLLKFQEPEAVHNRAGDAGEEQAEGGDEEQPVRPPRTRFLRQSRAGHHRLGLRERAVRLAHGRLEQRLALRALDLCPEPLLRHADEVTACRAGDHDVRVHGGLSVETHAAATHGFPYAIGIPRQLKWRSPDRRFSLPKQRPRIACTSKSITL